MNKIDLRDISIRGRVAFSICCLNSIVRALNYSHLDWSFLLNKLWVYTSAEYLDDWEDMGAEIKPDTIMYYEKYEPADFEIISKEDYDRLRSVYQVVDSRVLKIVDLIFYIGTIDLYGKVLKEGKSLEYLQRIIAIMEESGSPLPNLELFEDYKFELEEGWGARFTVIDIYCR